MQETIRKLGTKSPYACRLFCIKYDIVVNGFPYDTLISFIDRHFPLEILGYVIEFALSYSISIAFDTGYITITYNNKIKYLKYNNLHELLSLSIRYVFHLIQKQHELTKQT